MPLPSKATNEQLIESYSRTKSVWKTAKEFNMCGQSVHERLQKLNITKNPNFTDIEIQRIKEFYGQNKTLPLDLHILVQELGRPLASINRVARKLGLTSYRRHKNEDIKNKSAERLKQYIKDHGHMRGMLGKKHSLEIRKMLSQKAIKWFQDASPERIREFSQKGLKTRLVRYGTLASTTTGKVKVSWKQGWREIGSKKIYCRSRWEANYAHHLQVLKQIGIIKDWEHETQAFWFEKETEGAICYIPDFKVTYTNGTHEWHEVKGWVDERSISKISKFKQYYPEEILIIKDSSWFKINNKILPDFIIDWEK